MEPVEPVVRVDILHRVWSAVIAYFQASQVTVVDEAYKAELAVTVVLVVAVEMAHLQLVELLLLDRATTVEQVVMDLPIMVLVVVVVLVEQVVMVLQPQVVMVEQV